jgi:hypothetical protein
MFVLGPAKKNAVSVPQFQINLIDFQTLCFAQAYEFWRDCAVSGLNLVN